MAYPCTRVGRKTQKGHEEVGGWGGGENGVGEGQGYEKAAKRRISNINVVRLCTCKTQNPYTLVKSECLVVIFTFGE